MARKKCRNQTWPRLKMTEREEFEKWAKGFGHPYHDVVPKHGPCSSDPSDVDSFSEMAWAAFERGFYCGAESAKPRWIPVEERLPEPNVEALILCKDGEKYLAILRKLWSEELQWGCCHTVFDDVTHWMPLPEVPE